MAIICFIIARLKQRIVDTSFREIHFSTGLVHGRAIADSQNQTPKYPASLRHSHAAHAGRQVSSTCAIRLAYSLLWMSAVHLLGLR